MFDRVTDALTLPRFPPAPAGRPRERALSDIVCEREDDCLRIRLGSGTANALTTAVIQDLARAVADANRDARGAMLCGGEKFFCNGLDLDWALACSRAEIKGDVPRAGGPHPRHVGIAPCPSSARSGGTPSAAAWPSTSPDDYRYAATGHVLIGKPEILLGVPNPYYGDQLLRFRRRRLRRLGHDLHRQARAGRGGAAPSGLVHETGPKAEVEAMAWRRLLFLRDLAPEAFQESKRMRLGKFCADLREQMPARIARQVENLVERRGAGPPPRRRGAAQAPPK